MKPSDFTVFPWDSVLQKHETEQVARNIMVILARNGNTWRELTWPEYKEERLADGEFSYCERASFITVAMPYCSDPEGAARFSPEWKRIYDSQKEQT